MLELFKQIKCFVFDVDGVMTDGTLLLLEDGQLARRMNIKDGYSLQLAIKKGYEVIVISGAVSAPVKQRFQKLGIHNVFMGVENKKEQMETCLEEKNIALAQVLFMGDDIPDYEAMSICALPCCPADAASEIKQVSKYISGLNGGGGCVRDVIEKVLKLNNDWELDTSVSSR